MLHRSARGGVGGDAQPLPNSAAHSLQTTFHLSRPSFGVRQHSGVPEVDRLITNTSASRPTARCHAASNALAIAAATTWTADPHRSIRARVDVHSSAYDGWVILRQATSVPERVLIPLIVEAIIIRVVTRLGRYILAADSLGGAATAARGPSAITASVAHIGAAARGGSAPSVAPALAAFVESASDNDVRAGCIASAREALAPGVFAFGDSG